MNERSAISTGARTESIMFKGSFVALVTPFRDGRLDLPALDALIDRMLEARIDGLVPCGTTGESPTLSADEFDTIVSACVKRAAGKTPVIAGTGSNCTQHTIATSRRAIDLGVDGVMVVSPYYNKPTQDGLFEHFSAIAEHVSKPIMLYNIPGRTGVTISADTIARLRASHDRIAAVKHATGEVPGVTELTQQTDIAILSGDDPLTLPMMSVGAMGVVSVIANLVPADVKALTDAALAGDWAGARRWHDRLFRLAQSLLSLATNPIPIKTALAKKGWLALEFRLPMCGMSGELNNRLNAVLKDYEETA
jgi:4-hydroxy-tetrahydrodipicolinate synthase